MALGSPQLLAKEFLTALVDNMAILILVLQMESLRLWVKLSEHLNSRGLVLLFRKGFFGQTSKELSEFLNLGIKSVGRPFKQ